MRILLKLAIIGALIQLPALGFGQEWEERSMSGISYKIPTPNRVIESSNGHAVTFDNGKVYITATVLPDSTEFKPQTNLELERYYNMHLNVALIRLRGKLRVSTDTIINDRLMHYSSAEVTYPDSVIMNYDLLQYYIPDTLIAFSCQYERGANESVRIRNDFFNNIDFGQKKSGSSPMRWIYLMWVVAALIVAAAVVLIRKRNRSRLRLVLP